MDSFRRLCGDCRHDRRVNGYRADETTRPTVGVPRQTGLAAAADHGRRRRDEHRTGRLHLHRHQLYVGRQLHRLEGCQIRLCVQRCSQRDRTARRRQNHRRSRRTGRRLRQDSPNDDFRPGPVRHRRTRRYGHAYRHSRNGYGQDTGYQKLHGYPRTLRNRPGRERRRRGESRTAAGRHADRFQRCGYALFRRIPASLLCTQRGAGQPRDRTRLGGSDQNHHRAR